MKPKKIIYIIIAVILIVIAFFAVTRTGFDLQGEDSWIKNEKGIYVEHGKPSNIPDYVSEQKNAIECALNLYQEKKQEGIQFNSQCLGTCGDFAVDIVNVPRNEEDNKIENQCEDYRNGIAKHFIELDKNGEIVRVD